MSERLQAGERVRVSSRASTGHYRTPFYLRGKRGVVLRELGEFANPEALAYHRPGLPRLALYQVEFEFEEVWAEPRERSRAVIIADIYRHWLEKDGGEST
jgi:nitrile hydratase subunit beta